MLRLSTVLSDMRMSTNHRGLRIRSRLSHSRYQDEPPSTCPIRPENNFLHADEATSGSSDLKSPPVLIDVGGESPSRGGRFAARRPAFQG